MGGINKRDHLIKTGQELIWSKGYDLCSIKDITSAANLPKGSFYHYFESKEKFALEAMADFIDSHPEPIPQQPISLESIESIIDKRIQSIIAIQFAKECYMSVMCHAYSDQEDDFRLQVIDRINQSNTTIRHLLQQLHDSKQLSHNLDLSELEEFIDFAWRGARLKARILQSETPLLIFKKYLLQLIL